MTRTAPFPRRPLRGLPSSDFERESARELEEEARRLREPERYEEEGEADRHHADGRLLRVRRWWRRRAELVVALLIGAFFTVMLCRADVASVPIAAVAGLGFTAALLYGMWPWIDTQFGKRR